MTSAGTNSDSIVIRPAEAGELRAVAALIAAQLAAQDGSSTADEEALYRSMADEALAERFPRECLAAVDSASGDGVVGCAVFSPLFGLPDNALGLRHLFVVPEYRRRGIGKRLMAAIAGRAVALGCTRIEWQVPRLDLDPRAFFEIVAPDSFRLNELTYCVDADGIRTLSQEP